MPNLVHILMTTCCMLVGFSGSTFVASSTAHENEIATHPNWSSPKPTAESADLPYAIQCSNESNSTEDAALVIQSWESGVGWFSVVFKTAGPLPSNHNLTHVIVNLIGPQDKEETMGIPPGTTKSSTYSISCFALNNDGSWTFNSTNSCYNMPHYQCSSYNITLIPQYWPSCPEDWLASSDAILTQPTSSYSVEVIPGNNWLKVSWLENICENTVTSYFMTVQTLVDTSLPLGPDKEPGEVTERIPFECVYKSTDEKTIFESEKCPDLFSFDACTHYSIRVVAESYGMYNNIPSNPVNTTIPSPKGMHIEISEMDSGSNWISFQWYLSERSCQSSMTGMTLVLTDIRKAEEVANIELSMSDCVYLLPDGFTFIFNTSFPGCRGLLPIRPCSDYRVRLIPHIMYSAFYSASNFFGIRTIPGSDTTALIQSMASGSDWISFQWTPNPRECRNVVTGYWLGITDIDANIPTIYQFISMSDCYPDLNVRQPIPYNSTMTCMGRIAAPVILPCSNYRVSVDPVFDIYRGVENSTNVRTIPGDVSTVIHSASSGNDWIGIQWQVSVDTCKDDITGFWMVLKDSQGIETPFDCLESIDPGNTSLVNIDTKWPCIDVSLIPCHDYVIDIMAIVDIKSYEASPDQISYTTIPDDELSTAIINEEGYGEDWISFKWTSSSKVCQRSVSGYRLNVTDTVARINQIGEYPVNCSASTTNYSFVTFNSSLSCASDITINPCTSYQVSVVPVFTINSEPFYGIDNSTTIGTKSGKKGEIRNLGAVEQGPHSIELQWIEPECKNSANLIYYDVSVNDSKSLKVLPNCLEVTSSGNKVSLVLNNNTSFSCGKVDLSSCSYYNIGIQPVYKLASANEDIASQETITNTLADEYEASVQNLNVLQTGKEWISLSWSVPSCRMPISTWDLTENASNYSVGLPADCPFLDQSGTLLSINISDRIECQNGDSITGLSVLPCSNYFIEMNVNYVDLEFQEGRNNTVQVSSEMDVPGGAKDVQSMGNPESISLEWNPPEQHPQCVGSYRLTLNGGETVTVADTRMEMKGLSPCSDYMVTITSLSPRNEEGGSVDVPANTSVINPAPVDSEIEVIYVNQSTRNISWLIPSPDYCISGYKVQAYEVDYDDNMVLNETVSGKDVTWIMLSEGFEQKKSYILYVRSYSDFNDSNLFGNASSKIFIWDSTADVMNIVSVAYGIIFVVILIAGLLIAYVIYKRRKNLVSVIQKKESSIRRESPAGLIPRISIGRKPILVSELSTKLNLMMANSGYELEKEFEEVKSISMQWNASFEVAQMPEHREKNRYSNILPYDHSRVKLNHIPERPNESDYINASFISGHDGRRTYIASQGPKQSTVNDFWRMCFEQNVQVIVALTLMEEKGREKCAQYWPTTGSKNFGNFSVQLANEIPSNSYTIRDLIITDHSSPLIPKVMRQLHYTKWPDFGCPENYRSLVGFIHAMRAENASMSCPSSRSLSPILIHCSAGVGRTGTLIALDILMQQALRHKVIDVVGTVLKIRKDRNGMVQTEEQYQSLYKCTEYYVRNELRLSHFIDGPSLNSTVYQSTDSLSSSSSAGDSSFQIRRLR